MVERQKELTVRRSQPKLWRKSWTDILEENIVAEDAKRCRARDAAERLPAIFQEKILWTAKKTFQKRNQSICLKKILNKIKGLST